eukprot:CAMPEP_0194534854 /NCGR_PEP_ID=MMETSP0253-20130528/73215_1 /TAXON_ID=2966 /ORGANISM="Noctiluca scintillans" /LENGTH=432 /DNA_ID=CAMNT_0039380561 /DNA_START=160 /DNA_END=1455 /DNA_ORIENTATION=+
MPREVITIQLGQAGCQVGQKVWELFCLEHDIHRDGQMPSDESFGIPDMPYNSFFDETSCGQHVPRSVFFDTDPSSKDDILAGKLGKLFHPDFVMGLNQGCRSNFFQGRTMARQFKVVDMIMEKVRKAADLCSNLQGFFVFHSIGGGTGSGVGVDLFEELHTEFQRKEIFEPLIYPSRNFSSTIVEPYNCIFATHLTRPLVDLTLMVDNQASYSMCKSNLKISKPTFEDLNHLIAQVVSSCTTSLRYETELNANLTEMVVNLVPEQTFRYPVLSLAPVRPPGTKHENFSTHEIVQDLFDERNLFADCGEYLKMNRYLSAVVLLRGVNARSHTNGQARRATMNMTPGTARPEPVQVNDAVSALHGMVNPKGGYRQSLRFLPWLEGGGFKIGVVGVPPTSPKGFMAECDRQGALIGNTTAVRQIFVRQYAKFLKL